MSIASEINRISGNVSDALDEIANKGVTIPSGSNSDDLASLIRQISGGDGYVWQDENGYVHLSDEQGDQTIIDALTVSGAGTSTAPTGHAYNPVTVPSGSAATPATTVTANPTISVSSGGLITATSSATKSVTPSVSAGWVASGTAGTITVSGSNTSQLSTQAAKTVTPTTAEQTAVAAGKYTTGAIKVAAIPSKYKDTTNADAVAADVLTGKVFVNGTGEVTGTMTNNGAVSKTLDATTNNQSYTVPAGYHNGSGTVSITLETKTATPSTSSQNITPTSGKVLSKVTVNAIPAKYGDTTGDDAVAANVLSGKKAHTILNGTATQITGTMANNGAVSKTLDATSNNQSYTVPAGYHNGSGTVSITLETKTATPSTSSQNITPTSGKVLSKVTVNAMPSGTAGTPTATKGTVSNHSVTVTPSVTNTTGYITGGTKTGTAVTVTASELASGNKAITSGGSTDVVGYSTASVAAGTAGTPSILLDSVSNHTATLYPYVQNTTGYITGSTKTGSAYTISASQLTSGTKSITENGTGIDVTNYSSVNVNVPIPETPKEKQINFIDYDGTLLYSYEWDEWMNVTSLPDNPSHDGLVAQGWNWTKAQIDDFLNEASLDDKIWVGQMYITDTHATRIEISLMQGRLHPYLGIAPNGTVIVDWGDDTSTSTITGTSLTTVKYADHEYEYEGIYTITLSASSGTFALTGTSTASYILKKDTSTTNLTSSRVYSNAIRKVQLGNDVVINGYAFFNCYSLESITIPNNITSIGSGGAFYGCYSLASITIPSDVTSINIHTFRDCYSLARIAIPSGVTSLGNYTFYNCYSLGSITLPINITTIGTYAFSACKSLIRLSIPLNVSTISHHLCDGCTSLIAVDIFSNTTTIGNDAFYNCYSLTNILIPPTIESITTGAFSGCYSLSNIVVPEDVTTIGSLAFEHCYGMGEYHFSSYTPPSLSSDAFDGIQSDCKIYVPSSRLSTYRTATNWSSYRSYLVGE